MEDKTNKMGKNCRALGVDYGQKRVGLATFAQGLDPFPLALRTLPSTPHEQFWQEISQIIEEELIDTIVIGLPTYLSGQESQWTQIVKQFALDFQQRFPALQFHFEEETLTSFEAEERMRHSPRYNYKVDKKMLDQISAVIILEQFFSPK